MPKGAGFFRSSKERCAVTDVNSKIDFILELEKLKGVMRQTKPVGLDRYENSAEHSWQATMTAMVLLEDAGEGVDALRVLKMMLIHDVVEIDAGDVFTYDEAARAEIADAEDAAARRIFSLLPEQIGKELLDLWLEFEACETASARFAKAIDRICPVLQNLAQEGQSWVHHGISRQRVIKKNAEIENASPALWNEINRQLLAVDYLTDE